MKVTAIVLAAGQGKRMQGSQPKQYMLVADKPILYYSLEAFEKSNVDEVILVVGQGERNFVTECVLQPYQFSKVKRIVEGGKERYHSVYEGLKAIENTDYVLIHDGARPFLTQDIINRVSQQVQIHEACVVGMPSKDTIKIVNSDQEVIQTPDRSRVWNVQTPQAFSYSIIKTAYDRFMESKAFMVTDDAMVVEAMLHLPVSLVEGSYHNIKITTPEDLVIAEALMKMKW